MFAQVFSCLEDACDQLSKMSGHASYIFECSVANTKKLLSLMVSMYVFAFACLPTRKRLNVDSLVLRGCLISTCDNISAGDLCL